MTPSSIFKTPEGEAAYFAAYDASLNLWPVSYESLMVPTRLGRTHVIASGPPDAPPLLLLHMASMSATMWYPNVGALSEHFRVYAVDVMNDLGKSIPEKPRNTRQASADWLCDVMDRLGIDRARIVGASNGGWVTLNQAIMTPERIERIALLGPAGGIRPLRLRFWMAMLPAVLFPYRADIGKAARSLAAPGSGLPAHDLIIKQLTAGFRHLRLHTMFGMAWLVVFKDQELSQLPMPVLLLVGDQEMICDPRASVERARWLIPNVEAELVPGAGHGPSMEQADRVNARLLDFLLSLRQPTGLSPDSQLTTHDS